MTNPKNQYSSERPTEPVPLRIEAAVPMSASSLAYNADQPHVRVEKTPVPIIWPRLRKMMVYHFTLVPSGEWISTGAPLASWYVVLPPFSPCSATNSRFPVLKVSPAGDSVRAITSFFSLSSMLLDQSRIPVEMTMKPKISTVDSRRVPGLPYSTTTSARHRALFVYHLPCRARKVTGTIAQSTPWSIREVKYVQIGWRHPAVRSAEPVPTFVEPSRVP
jgi:hypothetical protein